MSKSDSKVYINILNYNTFEKSRKCIISCLKQKNVNFKVLLIDNFSTDDSLLKLKNEFADKIEYLENDNNYGYAKGNNLGIDYCYNKGIKYSLILNSDIELTSEFVLYNLLKIMQDYEQCAIVAPSIYNYTKNGFVLNENDSNYLKLLRFLKILPKNHFINDEVQEISEAHGSALLVDNEKYKEVNGFPEHYFMYGEEGTFAKKILWKRYKILWYKSEKNKVIHYHDTSDKMDNWRLFLIGRNRALEYFENRYIAKFRWKIAFLLSNTLLKIKKQYEQLDGVKEAREIKNKDFEEIFYDGKKIAEGGRTRNDI